MKKISFTIIALLACVLFTACKKDPAVNIESFHFSEENITPDINSVHIEGAFVYSGAIDGIKLCVSENEDGGDLKVYPAELDGKSFSVTATNLSPGTTYYYYYSINYGMKEDYKTASNSFKTKGDGVAQIVTLEVTYISDITAIGGGNILNDGGYEITERGVCWSTEQNPTIDDSHSSNGGGDGEYSCAIEGLTPNTTYYVRAYAISNKTIYGQEVSFTTFEEGFGVPEVTTAEITDIHQVTAMGGGEVTNENGSPVSERGICWSLEPTPTINDYHTSNGEGMGTYLCLMEGLTPNTTYYVRAYAYGRRIAYGQEVTFTTKDSSWGLPEVTTANITNITQTSAKAGGEVVGDAGFPISERGVCWSLEQNPTIEGNLLSDGSEMGVYYIDIEGLEKETVYYVRAYAINEIGVGYGEEVSFKTKGDGPSVPTVTTTEVTEIVMDAAVCGGNVIDDGGADVITRGICWSTSPNPSINDSHANSGTGLGEFTIQMTGLTPGETYYVRAYAMNSTGISYGQDKSFTTYNPDLTGEWICTEYNDDGDPSAVRVFTINSDGTVVCSDFYNYPTSSFSVSGAGDVRIGLHDSSGDNHSYCCWNGRIEDLDNPISFTGEYYNGWSNWVSSYESPHRPFVMVRNNSK